jgi:YHS domain-containing protein
MQTQNKIELNLKESKYQYEFKNFIFYFSSLLYLDKFKKNLDEYIVLETIKIKNKYKLHVDFSLFLAVALYKKIEKRGFRVVHKNMGFVINELTVFNAELFS